MADLTYDPSNPPASETLPPRGTPNDYTTETTQASTEIASSQSDIPPVSHDSYQSMAVGTGLKATELEKNMVYAFAEYINYKINEGYTQPTDAPTGVDGTSRTTNDQYGKDGLKYGKLEDEALANILAPILKDTIQAFVKSVKIEVKSQVVVPDLVVNVDPNTGIGSATGVTVNTTSSTTESGNKKITLT